MDREDIVNKFDKFVGIEMLPDGKEHYVLCNIKSGGSLSSPDLDLLYNFIRKGIDNGDKILLNIPPKYESKKRTGKQFLETLARSMSQCDGDVPDFVLSEDNHSEYEYELSQRIYLPLDPLDQLSLYERFKKDDIPAYKNPFNYQISIEGKI